MSLGFRHLVWNRARFSGRCWATARLTDGAVPLALDAAAACWCRSPHGLTSVSPASPLRVSCPARVPLLVAAFGHGLSLQGPVVLCAHLCPVLSVSEARAQLSALTTVLSSPARFSASERCPARRPVPSPGLLPSSVASCARPDRRRSLSPPSLPQFSFAHGFRWRFLFPGYQALWKKCFIEVTE